jgi:hypothetical protein
MRLVTTSHVVADDLAIEHRGFPAHFDSHSVVRELLPQFARVTSEYVCRTKPDA